jgi:hypothetical protein
MKSLFFIIFLIIPSTLFSGCIPSKISPEPEVEYAEPEPEAEYDFLFSQTDDAGLKTIQENAYRLAKEDMTAYKVKRLEIIRNEVPVNMLENNKTLCLVLLWNFHLKEHNQLNTDQKNKFLLFMKTKGNTIFNCMGEGRLKETLTKLIDEIYTHKTLTTDEKKENN